MSIYGTWLSFDGDAHEEDCAVWIEVEPMVFDRGDAPCNCGRPNAPFVYEGSQVLPSPDDRKGGWVDVAAIPAFIEREGRAEGPHDWLRLSMGNPPSDALYQGKPYVAGGDAVLVLDRPQVEQLRDTLTAWLEREEDVD